VAEQKKIEFRKTRDFGQKFNATFEFLRQELKPLFKGIFYIAGPFIAIAAIIGSYYQKYSLSLLNLSFENPEELFANEFGISSVALLLSSILAYIIIFADAMNEVIPKINSCVKERSMDSFSWTPCQTPIMVMMEFGRTKTILIIATRIQAMIKRPIVLHQLPLKRLMVRFIVDRNSGLSTLKVIRVR